jgi:hypothetical protein
LAGLVILASQVLEYHLVASSSQSVSGFWGTYGTCCEIPTVKFPTVNSVAVSCWCWTCLVDT